VLVTSTVKDLVTGSGIEFDDRGEHALKGVPGEWRIFLSHPPDDVTLMVRKRDHGDERESNRRLSALQLWQLETEG
jgi:hypothetical protein